MPDITMCLNSCCTLKKNCYRFQAQPNPFSQAYNEFEQDDDEYCEFYWPILNEDASED
jgi:hypothetical protein